MEKRQEGVYPLSKYTTSFKEKAIKWELERRLPKDTRLHEIQVAHDLESGAVFIGVRFMRYVYVNPQAVQAWPNFEFTEVTNKFSEDTLLDEICDVLLVQFQLSK